MGTDSLNPCPFCGSKAEVMIQPTGYKAVSCTSDVACAGRVFISYDEDDDAIKAWNKRTSEPVSIEEVARAICKSHHMMTPFDMRNDGEKEIALDMARNAIAVMEGAGSVVAKASCVSNPQIGDSSASSAQDGGQHVY